MYIILPLPGPYCAADVQYKFIFLPNLCIQGHDVNCMNKIYGHHSFGRRFNAYFLAGSCPLWGYASKDPQRMAIIHFPDLTTHSNMKTPTGNHSATEQVQEADTQAKWILNDVCTSQQIENKNESTDKLTKKFQFSMKGSFINSFLYEHYKLRFIGQLCPFRCTRCFIGNRFPDAALKWAYICRHSGLHHRFPVGKIPSVPYMDADRVTHKFTTNHLFASKLQCTFAVASYWRVVSTKSLRRNRYFKSN